MSPALTGEFLTNEAPGMSDVVVLNYGFKKRGPWPFWKPPGFPDGDVLFLACEPLWVSSVGGVWMGQVDRG